MWDCHSCDPGSNPGPGVQPSVRIPTTTSIIDPKNNKDHIINPETTATISIVQQQQQQQQKKIILVAINIKLPNYLKIIRCEIFITERRN
jgi:hypothetical protein